MESKNNEAASDINKIFSESLRHKFDDDVSYVSNIPSYAFFM